MNVPTVGVGMEVIQTLGHLVSPGTQEAMWSGLRHNSGKTDGWGVAAMATPDVTHPRGLWAGHAPCSAEAPSFVSLSVYACAVGAEDGGRGLRQEEQGS